MGGLYEAKEIKIKKKAMKEITINGTVYVPKSTIANDVDGLTPVLIRSYASGVHFGLLESKRDTPQGLEVTLRNSRRVHYWEGAASLSQMAVDGIGKPDSSRVSVFIDSITVQNVIETIPLSEKAFKNLKNQPIWKV